MCLLLILAIPVIVTANPLDPNWQPGWYDDGDTDQLVTQTMSPESMVGLAVLLFSSFCVFPLSMRGRELQPIDVEGLEPPPRGPPADDEDDSARFATVEWPLRTHALPVSPDTRSPHPRLTEHRVVAGVGHARSVDQSRFTDVIRSPTAVTHSERGMCVSSRSSLEARLVGSIASKACRAREVHMKWAEIAAEVELHNSPRRRVPYRTVLTMVVILGLGACAPEVVRRPTEFVATQNGPPTTVEVLAETKIEVGSGYERVIRRGSMGQLVGRVPEGEIYKPMSQVFTIEGAHVHEAYLVLDGDKVVGFYLPVERAFSPAPTKNGTPLSVQRRQP